MELKDDLIASQFSRVERWIMFEPTRSSGDRNVEEKSLPVFHPDRKNMRMGDDNERENRES
jgi:hypothetical protein